jgi:arsenical pump membrane protein
VTEIELVRLADRIVPILGFVLCISVVAELADRIGVFAVLADRVAVLARGSVWRLWLLVVILATLATMVLSLDTTAVLVTPVVLALAAQLGLDRMLFAYTAIWLANTASLLLPVSNLTNLLSVRVLGMAAPAFTRLMWPAAMAGIVVTVAALALIFQRSLRGRYTRISNIHFWDRSLLAIAMIVCLALGSLFAIGVNVTYASAVAALVLVVACLLRAPQLLSLRLVPWTLLAGVSALFVGVQVAHDHGLGAVLGVAAGRGRRGVYRAATADWNLRTRREPGEQSARLPGDGAGGQRFRPADGRIAGGGQHRPTHHPMGESGDAAMGESLSSGGHPDPMADLRPPRTDHCAGPHRRLGCGDRGRSDDAAHRRTAGRLNISWLCSGRSMDYHSP